MVEDSYIFRFGQLYRETPNGLLFINEDKSETLNDPFRMSIIGNENIYQFLSDQELPQLRYYRSSSDEEILKKILWTLAPKKFDMISVYGIGLKIMYKDDRDVDYLAYIKFGKNGFYQDFDAGVRLRVDVHLAEEGFYGAFRQSGGKIVQPEESKYVFSDNINYEILSIAEIDDVDVFIEKIMHTKTRILAPKLGKAADKYYDTSIVCYTD